jgi:hypothetical protein
MNEDATMKGIAREMSFQHLELREDRRRIPDAYQAGQVVPAHLQKSR